MASLNDIETKIQSIIDKLSIKTITGTLPLTFTAKGGTAVDWVIYGNDENGTENLCPPFNLQGRYISDTFQPSTEFISTVIFECEPNATYRFSCDQPLSWAVFALFDENHTFIEPINRYNNSYFVINIPSSAHYVGISGKGGSSTQVGDITNQSFTNGSTAPDHYIPYQKGVGEQRVDGYYVPLTVSQTGQTDKTYDIYIGDSPLTEGETVSKASTGVDIELFEGENVISTTLYNKPTMKINYNGGN